MADSSADPLTQIPQEYYWVLAKGRVRPSEPLYGIQILDPKTGAIITEAEHDDRQECVALALRALNVEPR